MMPSVELFEGPGEFVATTSIDESDGEVTLEVRDTSVAVVAADGQRLVQLGLGQPIDREAVTSAFGPNGLAITIPKRDRTVAGGGQELRFLLL